MTDIGVSCHKDSYGRGVGKTLTCTKEQEYDAGLCYTPCAEGANGVGPVCWGQCPAGTNACGSFLCLKEGETCTDSIVADTANIAKLLLDAATGAAAGSVIDIATIAAGFVYPTCPSWM